jgi:PBP1b-binding outer membrane lipoprotein LpoB
MKKMPNFSILFCSILFLSIMVGCSKKETPTPEVPVNDTAKNYVGYYRGLLLMVNSGIGTNNATLEITRIDNQTVEVNSLIDKYKFNASVDPGTRWLTNTTNNCTGRIDNGLLEIEWTVSGKTTSFKGQKQ